MDNYVQYNQQNPYRTPYGPNNGIPGYFKYQSIIPLVPVQANSGWPQQIPNLNPRSSNGQVRSRTRYLEHHNIVSNLQSKNEARTNGEFLSHSKRRDIDFGDAANQLNRVEGIVTQLKILQNQSHDSHKQIRSSMAQIASSQDGIRMSQDRIQRSLDQTILRLSRLEEKMEEKEAVKMQEISKQSASQNHTMTDSGSGLRISGNASKRRGSDRKSSTLTRRRKSVQNNVSSKAKESGGEVRRRSKRLANTGTKRAPMVWRLEQQFRRGTEDFSSPSAIDAVFNSSVLC